MYAVDSVTGAGFTPTDGAYYLDLMAASSPDGSAPGTCIALAEGAGICFYFVRIQVTSWVLCYEPPIATPPQGHIHRLNDLVQQGISPADLARVPTESPGRTTAADRTRRILQQLDLPVSLSVCGTRNVASGRDRHGRTRGADVGQSAVDCGRHILVKRIVLWKIVVQDQQGNGPAPIRGLRNALDRPRR